MTDAKGCTCKIRKEEKRNTTRRFARGRKCAGFCNLGSWLCGTLCRA